MPKLIIGGPRPSAAIRAQYSRALLTLIREMFADVNDVIKADYPALASEYAADEKPPSLFDRLKETFKKWDKKFDKFADTAAKWFAKKTNASTTARLAGAMKDAGLTVKFKPSPKVAGLVDDIVAANVGLIKTIPQDLMTWVNNVVLESTLKGRDMGAVAKEIRKGYGITERRAVMIARDQTNKATEAIGRARVQEVGVTHGFWMHRSGGKVPRETHIGVMDGQRFPLADGLFDPDPKVQMMIQPGELVNCFPGDSKIYGFPFAEKLFRRFYSGELAQVITDNNVAFSVTPNHPILTDKGWKPAGLLDVGDYVLQTRSDNVLAAELDSYNAVPTFKDFFDSLISGGIPAGKLLGSASDFHGDGTESEIDVIDINGFLRDIGDSQIVKKGRKFGLTGAEVATAARLLAGKGAGAKFGDAVSASPDGIMGGLRERLAVFLGSLTIAELIGLLLIADNNAAHLQATPNNISATAQLRGNGVFALAGLIHGFDLIMGDDSSIWRSLGVGDNCPSFPDVTAESAGVSPQLLCNGLNGATPKYGFARVINNSRRKFSGHVYNLQTSLGYYIAQKTISCNCHCTFKLDLSTMGGAGDVAMDAKRGTARLNLPGAVITWGLSA